MCTIGVGSALTTRFDTHRSLSWPVKQRLGSTSMLFRSVGLLCVVVVPLVQTGAALWGGSSAASCKNGSMRKLYNCA
jgi:hypothetical protein